MIQRKLDTSKDDASNAFWKFNADPESSAEFTGRGRKRRHEETSEYFDRWVQKLARSKFLSGR